MSEHLRSSILEGDRDGALRAAEAMLTAGEVDRFTAAVVELLAGDMAWSREGTLEMLRALTPHPDLVAHLVAELSSGSHPDRRNAARSALAMLVTPGGADPGAPLPELTRCLAGDPDANVRILCANVLGESGNPRAREALEAALQDPEPNVVAAAAEALGGLNDPRAVDALVRLAERRDFWTGNAAVMALGELRDARAVPALCDLTRDPWLAAEAARALGKIGDTAALESLRDMVAMPEEARHEAIQAAAQIVTGTGVAPPSWLREALRDEEDALVGRFEEDGELDTARLLGLAGTARSASALLDRLPDDPDGAAAVGLELLPRQVRADSLLSRLDTPRTEEVPTLLALLPPLGTREAVERVAEFLADERPEVHAAAAEALSRSDVEMVMAVLDELRGDPRARLGVALAYGRLGSDRCTPLLAMLRDEDPRVRAAAAQGVARCGVATTGELSAALQRETDPTVERALVRALGNEGGDEAVVGLGAVLREGDPALRFEAVRALGCTGSAAAFPLLMEALSDPDPGIRTIALSALGELGDPRAEQPLARHIDDPDRDRRRIAAAAIGRLYGGKAGRKLEGALRDPDREVRLVAVQALGRLRPPGAVAALERVAEEDPDPLVRHAAALVAAALQDSGEEDS